MTRKPKRKPPRSPFRYRLERWGRSILFQVLAMPEDWRGEFSCRRKNGVRVGSRSYPSIGGGYIWLRGRLSDMDFDIPLEKLSSISEAKVWYKKYAAALREAAGLARKKMKGKRK